jgi:hypothetical protein
LDLPLFPVLVNRVANPNPTRPWMESTVLVSAQHEVTTAAQTQTPISSHIT